MPNTLANLVSAFSASTTSYLSQAQALDLELYELNKDLPKTQDPGPSLVEETPTVALLKTIVEQLQQVAQYTFNTASSMGAKKVAKVNPLSRPKTARNIWDQLDARRKFQFLESVIRFVPQEEFDQHIAESGGE